MAITKVTEQRGGGGDKRRWKEYEKNNKLLFLASCLSRK